MAVTIVWILFILAVVVVGYAARAYGRACGRKLDALRAEWNEETEWLERIRNV